MFPASITFLLSFFKNSYVKVVVVVFPLLPVIPISFMFLSFGMHKYAISTSFITGIPNSFAFNTYLWSIGTPGFFIK